MNRILISFTHREQKVIQTIPLANQDLSLTIYKGFKSFFWNMNGKEPEIM